MIDKENVLFTVYKSDDNYKKLFDEAVKLCLSGDLDTNKNEIIKLFIRSYLNEQNLEYMSFGIYNKNYKRELFGLSIDKMSLIYLKENCFNSIKTLSNDISTLFHELEHAKTDDLNKDKSWFRNVNKDNFCGNNYELYITSPNEHNSRLAEAKYLERFIRSAEKLMGENLDTKLTVDEKWLNKFIKATKIREDNINYEYEHALKKKNRKLFKFSQYNTAKKSFNIITKLENKNIDIDDYIDTTYEINNILDYMKSYKDEKFANKVLSHIQQNQNRFLAKNLKVSDIFNSGTINFSRDKIDEILFKFPTDKIIRELSGEDLMKHSLLFYGDIYATSYAGKQLKEAEKIQELYKDYKFKGIPIKEKYNKFAVTINGEEKFFDSKEDAYIETSKHINLTALDDVSDDKIKDINSLFGEDVITSKTHKLENPKSESLKETKNLKEKNKKQSSEQTVNNDKNSNKESVNKQTVKKEDSKTEGKSNSQNQQSTAMTLSL